MERNGCTRTEKASKVVKDVDLSYLTLTALTLERMKRKRGVEERGQREKKRVKKLGEGETEEEEMGG